MRASILLTVLIASFAFAAAPAAARQSFSGPGGPLVDANGDSEGIAFFTINVSGTGATIASLDSITLTSMTHTWLGDLVVVLVAPDDETFVLATSPPDLHSADLNGTYTFRVSNVLPTIDEAGDGQNNSFIIPSGDYAASDYGGGTELGPRVDWAEMQGVALDGAWVLQVYDFVEDDTGNLGSWGFAVSVPEPAGAGLVGAAAFLLLARRRRADHPAAA